jgi:hypothetical protein
VKAWRVPLPRGAEPPYRVYVNGVPQHEGDDYRVVGHELHFTRPLEKERLGLGRWTAIFLGLFGSYGKNDSVDVQYKLGGRDALATGLDIVAPGDG